MQWKQYENVVYKGIINNIARIDNWASEYCQLFKYQLINVVRLHSLVAMTNHFNEVLCWLGIYK